MMAQIRNPPQITEHIAMRLRHYIVVLSGKKNSRYPDHIIFTYNLYTEVWAKHKFSRRTQVPSISSRGCSATIGEDIYISCYTEPYHDSIFTLTQTERGCFVWNTVREKHWKQTPSPREYHTAWEHGGNFWIFGGQGPPPHVHHLMDYGDFNGSCNNQLLQFNIVLREWKNIHCFGAIPAPRKQHASTIVGDTVWLYGGRQKGPHAPLFDDLYQLDLHTHSWTMIKTGETKPPGCHRCMFNAVSGSQLILHGGRIAHAGGYYPICTWILDLPSCTWKRHKPSEPHRQANQNPGTSGLNKDVIIIGGISPDSRAASGHYYTTKDGCHVMLEPKCLQQLAMRAVFEHGAELPWKEHLPKKLIKLMDLNLVYIPPKTDKWVKIDTSYPSLVQPVSKTMCKMASQAMFCVISQLLYSYCVLFG